MNELLTEIAPPADTAAAADHARWVALSAARTTNETAKAWLALQCRRIANATHGLLLLARDDDELFEPVAVWPDGGGRTAELSEAARAALSQQQGVVQSGPARGASGAGKTLGFPIALDGTVRGAVAIFVSGDGDPTEALRRLQWGTAWIRDALRRDAAEQDRRLLEQSRVALDILAESLEHDSFQQAAIAVATELALRFACTRVSIGFVRRQTVEIGIISHTAQFRRQMDLIKKITAAMNEAVDQRAVVVYPLEGPRDLATMAHADLSRLQRDSRLLTVPIFKVDRFVGAVTFERPPNAPFGSKLLQLLEAVVAGVGPVLDEKRRNDRWLGAKAAETIRLQLVRLLGPGHILRKLVVVALLGLSLFFYFATSMYRVDADARLEGTVLRAVVAPYDGFIREADVRAGDMVKRGQVMAALDDRDLALERLRWVTERQQRLYEYAKALATREPAATNVTKSQIDQAEAQIKLIDEQLARDTMRAPLDGLVVSGDLSQMIGTSVNRGQVLFEVAPLDGYRVILSVDERQIGDVAVGETGMLVTNALPNDRFAFTVDKLTPIAEPRNGRNVFRVEGRLTENSDRLRPGMEGVAKIDIGRRRLIWIWTRSFVEWLRLWTWQYF